MHSLEDIRQRSLSGDQLVVEYMDAMDALAIFSERGVRVLGWEGWLVHRDGSIGRSSRYKGIRDLSAMSNRATIALTQATMMQANGEWNELPEIRDAELYFCINFST